MKIASNSFDATVLALQLQSCDDMMQSIAALKSNGIWLMQRDAIDYITKTKIMFICNVFRPMARNHYMRKNSGGITYYASWGLIFWPFLRRSVRAPTSKAVRGTVAIKGIFDN